MNSRGWFLSFSGEVSNILYEDVTLLGADTAIDVGTFAPCKWYGVTAAECPSLTPHCHLSAQW